MATRPEPFDPQVLNAFGRCAGRVRDGMGKDIGLGQHGDLRRNRQHADMPRRDHVIQKLPRIYHGIEPLARDKQRDLPQADVVAGERESVRRKSAHACRERSMLCIPLRAARVNCRLFEIAFLTGGRVVYADGPFTKFEERR